MENELERGKSESRESSRREVEEGATRGMGEGNPVQDGASPAAQVILVPPLAPSWKKKASSHLPLSSQGLTL